jgi:hypothetical protein
MMMMMIIIIIKLVVIVILRVFIIIVIVIVIVIIEDEPKAALVHLSAGGYSLRIVRVDKVLVQAIMVGGRQEVGAQVLVSGGAARFAACHVERIQLVSAETTDQITIKIPHP